MTWTITQLPKQIEGSQTDNQLELLKIELDFFCCGSFHTIWKRKTDVQ